MRPIEPCGLPYVRDGDVRECRLPYNHDLDCPEANHHAFLETLEARTWQAQNAPWL